VRTRDARGVRQLGRLRVRVLRQLVAPGDELPRARHRQNRRLAGHGHVRVACARALLVASLRAGA
jgi:hypothetical protein